MSHSEFENALQIDGLKRLATIPAWSPQTRDEGQSCREMQGAGTHVMIPFVRSASMVAAS